MMTLAQVKMILILVGALNWGVIGATSAFARRSVNPVNKLVSMVVKNVSTKNMIVNAIYIAVGVSALLMVLRMYFGVTVPVLSDEE